MRIFREVHCEQAFRWEFCPDNEPRCLKAPPSRRTPKVRREFGVRGPVTAFQQYGETSADEFLRNDNLRLKSEIRDHNFLR